VSTLGCCAQPNADLWPPREGERRVEVTVIYRDWHTMLLHEELAPPPSDAALAPPLAMGAAPKPFTLWEFAEKAWYLEGRQGVTGAVRALLWPTESALLRRELSYDGMARTLRSGEEEWRFVVSERGSLRMKRYLESLRGEPLEGFPDWYRGTRSYSIRFLCHHPVLYALREAGLPTTPWWGYTAWLTGLQLDRVSRFHADAGLLTERVEPQAAPAR